MSSKLINWLKHLKKASDLGLETDDDLNKRIAGLVLESKKEEMLGILIQAFKLDNSVIEPDVLANAVLKYAPILSTKLRNMPGIDNENVEANSLMYASTKEAIASLQDWYGDCMVPSSLQKIITTKLYSRCYPELTSGQADDRCLSGDNIDECIELFKVVPSVINDSAAIDDVLKLSAYILKSVDSSALESNNKLQYLHDLIFDSFCNLYKENYSSLKNVKQLVSENKKLFDYSINYIKLTYPDIAIGLDSTTSIDKPILSRLHKKNKPVAIDIPGFT